MPTVSQSVYKIRRRIFWANSSKTELKHSSPDGSTGGCSLNPAKNPMECALISRIVSNSVELGLILVGLGWEMVHIYRL